MLHWYRKSSSRTKYHALRTSSSHAYLCGFSVSPDAYVASSLHEVYATGKCVCKRCVKLYCHTPGIIPAIADLELVRKAG